MLRSSSWNDSWKFRRRFFCGVSQLKKSFICYLSLKDNNVKFYSMSRTFLLFHFLYSQGSCRQTIFSICCLSLYLFSFLLANPRKFLTLSVFAQSNFSILFLNLFKRTLDTVEGDHTPALWRQSDPSKRKLSTNRLKNRGVAPQWTKILSQHAVFLGKKVLLRSFLPQNIFFSALKVSFSLKDS